ncbi:T9SS type B sorting domain-containing protein [Polaribacter staleyi]|uniref:T9SS type B sorting domain-containing protein n=1 Tax=Polaribacter staleyi TaxID=2022337 RepID=UPI0031BB2854
MLPNPFTNSVKDKETITVRVARNEEQCCYSEITFDLIINSLPDVSKVEDIFECNGDSDGFATFNLSQIQSDLTANNIQLDFYFQDGQQISSAQLNAVDNKVKNQESITVRVTNKQTNCYNETTFNIVVSSLPIANTLADIAGCDDNNDGISEYFDTSTIETLVLGNQTGMVISYFNSNGNQLSSPLPNPYTNIIANQEILTVRVTNPITKCYAETFLNLITSTQPQINQPLNLYACDEGNGIGYFDTSTIENQLIGNQIGLLIFYSDKNGNELSNPLPINYQNTVAWSQTINVRVENELNSLCYSETSFEMIVNELPKINLENNYFLCDLEPSLYITSNSTFDYWKWTFEDGSVISNSFEANLIDAGIYTLRVSKINNGTSCENSFSLNLIRSNLPKIDEVKIQDISDNNYVEIITSGDGDFEYSIDGFNFQDDNRFYNLLGGIYNIQVRDKKGCGLDEQEVVLVDYPKFFTPNNDGFNDNWQIRGIEKFPNSVIYIFDRFGKLLKQLTFNDLGWDGTYNGKHLFASDYWFTAYLGDSRSFKGHFSLIR